MGVELASNQVLFQFVATESETMAQICTLLQGGTEDWDKRVNVGRVKSEYRAALAEMLTDRDAAELWVRVRNFPGLESASALKMQTWARRLGGHAGGVSRSDYDCLRAGVTEYKSSSYYAGGSENVWTW